MNISRPAHDRKWNMTFSIWSQTEATVDRLETAKKEEAATVHIKRQGNGRTVFRLIWNCSRGMRPSTVNKLCYKEILRCLCNPICCKCPERWYGQKWRLPRDNAAPCLPKRSCKTTCHHFAKSSILTQTSPWDFVLFPRLRGKLCEHRFQSDEEAIAAMSGTFVKCLSTVFPAPIATLTDLHKAGDSWFCLDHLNRVKTGSFQFHVRLGKQRRAGCT
jgi:hypothetical protein